MKRHLAAIIVVTLLCGCSSAGKLRNASPTAVYVGNNTAEDVAACVTKAWSAKPFQLNTVPAFGGTSIQLQQSTDGPILALVDITPTGPTTTAKYYSQMPTDDTWFFEQVQNCME